MIKFFIGCVPVILCIIVGCGSKDKELHNCTDKDGQPLRIEERLDSINRYIDSTLILYQASIDHLKKNPQDTTYLAEHFQSGASLHYGKIVNGINEVNKIYATRKLNQDCYDLFTQQLQQLLTRLKSKKKELQEMGYKFQLHNPYIKQ